MPFSKRVLGEKRKTSEVVDLLEGGVIIIFLGEGN